MSVTTDVSETRVTGQQARRAFTSDFTAVFIRSENGQLGERSQLMMSILACTDLQPDIYDVGQDGDYLEIARELSGCEYFPQLFVRGEFIGGASIAHEFIRSREYLRLSESPPCFAGAIPGACDSAKSEACWRLVPGPDGSYIGCGANGTLSLANMGPKAQNKEHKITDGWVNAATTAHHHEIVFCGTTDAETVVYDTRRSDRVTTIKHGRWVNDVAHVQCRDTVLAVDGSGELSEICAVRSW